MGFSKNNIHTEEALHVAKIAKVFGHPARIAIIQHISNCTKGCNCNDLVQEIGLAQPTISQHLSEIKKIGLLNLNEKGKKLDYTINTDNLNTYRRTLNDFFVKTQIRCS